MQPTKTEKGETSWTAAISRPVNLRVFQGIRSPFYDNIALTSCSINGERGVAIVMLDEAGEDKVAVMPLLVAITPGMKIDFPASANPTAAAVRRMKKKPRPNGRRRRGLR